MLSSKLTEEDLKSQLIEEINKLGRNQLVMLHQFIARLVAEDLIDAVSKDWESGQVNRESIQKAIEEHRKLHPYQEREE